MSKTKEQEAEWQKQRQAFADAISMLMCSPKCPYCSGRAYDGFVKLPDGRSAVLRCRNAKVQPSEYSRTIGEIRRLPDAIDEIVAGHASLLFRATFWGGLGWFFGYKLRLVFAYQWLKLKTWGKPKEVVPEEVKA